MRAARRPPSGGRDPMTLKARVIPCLDVKDGRVVKGVNFVNLRDAGDPVESAIAYDQGGRGRALLSRHHREPRRPRHPARRRAAHGGSLLHAADGRRRRPHDRRHPQPPARRRRQGLDQFGRGRRPRVRAPGGGEIRQPMRRRRHRRQARLGARRGAALGNLHPRRPAADRHRRGRLTRARSPSSGRAKSS